MHLIYPTPRTSELSLTDLKQAQNTHISLLLCNYLEFPLKSTCFPLLLTRNRRHRWAFYRHDEIQKQYSKDAGDTVYYRVPCGWKPGPLLLPASQGHIHRIALAQEKIKIQILKYIF